MRTVDFIADWAAGWSLKEIGDHLGHQSADTTAIYAKVDFPERAGAST